MANRLQLRRGNSADRTSITPAVGEPLWDTDTQNLYVGDGSTAGGILITGTDTNTTYAFSDSDGGFRVDPSDTDSFFVSTGPLSSKDSDTTYTFSDSDGGFVVNPSDTDAYFVSTGTAGSGTGVDTDSIIAGTNITVRDTEGGVVISSTASGGGGGSLINDTDFRLIEENVEDYTATTDTQSVLQREVLRGNGGTFNVGFQSGSSPVDEHITITLDSDFFVQEGIEQFTLVSDGTLAGSNTEVIRVTTPNNDAYGDTSFITNYSIAHPTDTSLRYPTGTYQRYTTNGAWLKIQTGDYDIGQTPPGSQRHEWRLNDNYRTYKHADTDIWIVAYAVGQTGTGPVEQRPEGLQGRLMLINQDPADISVNTHWANYRDSITGLGACGFFHTDSTNHRLGSLNIQHTVREWHNILLNKAAFVNFPGTNKGNSGFPNYLFYFPAIGPDSDSEISISFQDSDDAITGIRRIRDAIAGDSDFNSFTLTVDTDTEHPYLFIDTNSTGDADDASLTVSNAGSSIAVQPSDTNNTRMVVTQQGSDETPHPLSMVTIQLPSGVSYTQAIALGTTDSEFFYAFPASEQLSEVRFVDTDSEMLTMEYITPGPRAQATLSVNHSTGPGTWQWDTDNSNISRQGVSFALSPSHEFYREIHDPNYTITISRLQSIVAAADDFAAFKTAIANLSHVID